MSAISRQISSFIDLSPRSAPTSMESEPNLPKTPATRHRCCACYKQFKKKEHLVDHMKFSFHSVHQPRCPVCGKHCKSFESLREHLAGRLPKAKCSTVFAERGCGLCLKLLDSPVSLDEHKETCRLSAPVRPVPLGTVEVKTEPEVDTLCSNGESVIGRRREAVAMDCEMVGGGSDGSLNVCARVCLVDEDENLLLHAYVQPQIPVTDYRYEATGLTEEHLQNAMPLKDVKDRISQILYNGESIGRARLDGGKARLLVGHDLIHDFDCLWMNYPDHLLRDTANYRPLMKTNLVSHSLKYLTRTYIGYDIQTGKHDPYEDCVSAMRLYKRMRDQDHHNESIEATLASNCTRNLTSDLGSCPTKELENMTPVELYHLSTSNYPCWCLDRATNTDSRGESLFSL